MTAPGVAFRISHENPSAYFENGKQNIHVCLNERNIAAIVNTRAKTKINLKQKELVISSMSEISIIFIEENPFQTIHVDCKFCTIVWFNRALSRQRSPRLDDNKIQLKVSPKVSEIGIRNAPGVVRVESVQSAAPSNLSQIIAYDIDDQKEQIEPRFTPILATSFDKRANVILKKTEHGHPIRISESKRPPALSGNVPSDIKAATLQARGIKSRVSISGTNLRLVSITSAVMDRRCVIEAPDGNLAVTAFPNGTIHVTGAGSVNITRPLVNMTISGAHDVSIAKSQYFQTNIKTDASSVSIIKCQMKVIISGAPSKIAVIESDVFPEFCKNGKFNISALVMENLHKQTITAGTLHKFRSIEKITAKCCSFHHNWQIDHQTTKLNFTNCKQIDADGQISSYT